jgi:hypothetical protein
MGMNLQTLTVTNEGLEFLPQYVAAFLMDMFLVAAESLFFHGNGGEDQSIGGNKGYHAGQKSCKPAEELSSCTTQSINMYILRKRIPHASPPFCKNGIRDNQYVLN